MEFLCKVQKQSHGSDDSIQVLSPELGHMSSLGSVFLSTDFIQAGLYHIKSKGL